MSKRDMKAIRERCEAAKIVPKGPYKVTAIGSICYQGKHHSRPLAQLVKGDLTNKTVDALGELFAHARQDMLALLDEIERLETINPKESLPTKCKHYKEMKWAEPPMEPGENATPMTDRTCSKAKGYFEPCCDGDETCCDLPVSQISNEIKALTPKEDNHKG